MIKKKRTKKLSQESGIVGFAQKNWQHILVFLFAFFLYANTIPNDYNMDDELVTKNHKLTSQGVKAIPEIFRTPYYSDAAGYSYDYRPVVHTTFAVEHQFFGQSAHVSHFFNVLLYAVLCLMIFLLIKKLVSGFSLSYLPLIAALIFAAHPIHTEAVASIKNRDEILAMLFSIVSWLFLLRVTAKRIYYLGIAVGFFLLAVLSKSTVVTCALFMPASLFLLRRGNYILILATAIIYSLASLLVMGNNYPITSKLLFAASPFLVLAGIYLLQNINGLARIFHRFRFELLLVIPFLLLGYYVSRAVKPYYLLIVGSILSALLYFFLKGRYQRIVAFFALQCFVFLVTRFTDYVILPDTVLVANIIVLLILMQGAEKPLRWFYLGFAALFIGIAIYTKVHEQVILFLVIFNAIMLIWPHKKYYNYFFYAVAPVFVLIIILGTLYDGKVDYDVLLTVLFLALQWAAARFTLSMNKREWLVFALSALVMGFTIMGMGKYDRMIKKAMDALPASKAKKEQIIKPQVISPQPTLPNLFPESVDRTLDFVEAPITFRNPWSERIANGAEVLVRYIKLCLIPYPMHYYYGYNTVEAKNLSDTIVVLSFLIHILLLLTLAWCIYTNRIFAAIGLMIYLFGIIIFSNVLLSVPGIMADRYLFLPSLGFSLLAALGIYKLLGIQHVKHLSELKLVGKIALTGLLLVYSAMTFSRNRDWKDSMTLFEHDMKYLDKSAQAHNLLALRYCQTASSISNPAESRALYEKGINEFKKAVAIYPDFFNAQFDIGRTYLLLQQNDSALPYLMNAARLDSSYITSYEKIGEILFFQKKYEQAEPYFRHMMVNRPQQYKGYDKLSFLYYTIGQYDSAIAVNRIAIQNMPQLPDPYVNIGRTYMGVNKKDSAHYYFDMANQLSPGNKTVQDLLNQTSVKH